MEISKIIIEKLYWEEKLSISEIARKFGVSYPSVWNKMSAHRIKRRTLSEANTLNNLSRKVIIPKKVLEDLYINKRLPSTRIAKMFNCHHSVVLRRMKEFSIKSRNLSEAMTKYSKKDFEGNGVERAYLIGFRHGDLYVKKVSPNGQTIGVECSTTDPEQIELIDKLFGKYGHRYSYQFKGFRDEIRINYYLNNSFEFLLEKSKNINKWILDNRKRFLAFSAGYIDAEGNIGVYERGGLKQATFSLSSYDKEIIRQIRIKLISESVKCGSFRICAVKGYITPKKRRPYRENVWGFRVDSKESLIRLFRLIQPYVRHPKTIRHLHEAIENIYWRNKRFGNLRM